MKSLLTPARTRYLLAIGAGVLQAASFPKIGAYYLAWLVPGTLVLLTTDQSSRKSFRIGYYAGLTHYLLSLYWLLLIPLPVQAIAAWLSVSGILALYTAGWTWLCSRLGQMLLATPQSANNPSTITPGAPHLELLLSASWQRRTLWTFSCACAWAAMEMGIARILTGFPWNFLAVSQYKVLALIQIASITGVYGVSFLMVWLSVSLGVTSAIAWHQRHAFAKCLGQVSLPLAVLLGVIGFGVHRLSVPQPSERELKLALVQPSIPQLVIWDDREKANRFGKLVALSREALATRPDVLVWPEAALPNVFTRFNRQTYAAVTNLVVPNHVWMIFGADDAEPKKHPLGANKADFFNSAFLVDPAGQLVARYHKRRLVMFGEYMPLAHWFPFLKYLRSVEGGFTPGEAPVPFDLAGLGINISVLICFEDVFPQLVRGAVSDDSDLLLNLTNNGWFGESAAQWQHAVSALFRAVENGVPLVRCTNNGLTCWVDPCGRLQEIYFPGTKDIYGAGFKLVRVPLPAKGVRRPSTFYQRHGDWFGWSGAGFTGLMLLKLLNPRAARNKTRPPH